jgi:hypothetical protein
MDQDKLFKDGPSAANEVNTNHFMHNDTILKESTVCSSYNSLFGCLYFDGRRN